MAKMKKGAPVDAEVKKPRKITKPAKASEAENPTSKADPRYQPMSDAESVAAHARDNAETKKTDKSDKEEEVQELLRTALEAAIQDYEENLEPDQVLATNYYYGRPFGAGNPGAEKAGRSKVVSTDVRDTTRSQLGPLMDIFFGPERSVEFKPRGPEDEALAAQQTEYVNYIVTEDNQGFLILYSVFKDALVRRLGIVKWWWEDEDVTEAVSFTGLSQQQLAMLAMEPEVEVEVQALYEDPQLPGETLFDVHAVHKTTDGRARFACIPPEEWMVTPGARDMISAPLVAHVRNMTKDELLAMGIDEDEIDEVLGDRKDSLRSNSLADARQYDQGAGRFRDEQDKDRDESERTAVYAEAYWLQDGDRRLFKTLGSNYKIVGEPLGEVVDELPFALFTPDPEPHTIVGLSNFDYLRDIQLIKSQVERGMLDSLAQSIDGAVTEVVKNKVEMSDVLSTDISRVVRSSMPGSINFIRPPFNGADILPTLGYYNDVIENRTGRKNGAVGLDADTLQSSTKAAVAATLSASQQQLKLLARVFAETGMKQMYKGLMRLVVKHQDKARVIRLRNQYVTVDPRVWDSPMDVQVNDGLGQGTTQERMDLLAKQFEQQMALMQMGSPLVSWVEIRSTLGKLAELGGFKSSDQFYRKWGPTEQQQMEQQQAQQPPQPSPEMALVEIEKMKAAAQLAMDQQKFQLEQWKAKRQDDLERDRLAQDKILKEQEMELKYSAQINEAKIDAEIERSRVSLDADIKREEMRRQPEPATA